LQLTDSAEDVFEIHRIKGLIPSRSSADGETDTAWKMLQGVRDIFEIVDLPPQPEESSRDRAERKGKIVLIGKGMSSQDWEGSLRRSLADNSQAHV
jgi:hypothetical protein